MGGHLSVSHDEATNNSEIQVDFVTHGEASAMGSLIIAIFGDFHTMSRMGWTLKIVKGNLTITAPTWVAGSMAPAITEMVAELTTSDAATAGIVSTAVHKIRSSFSSRKKARQWEGEGQPPMGEGEHVSQTMRRKFQQLMARKKAGKMLDPTYGAIDQTKALPWAQDYRYALQQQQQQQPFALTAFPGAESALVPHDPRVAAAAWSNQQAFQSGGMGYGSMQHNGYLIQGAAHDASSAMMTTWANHPAYTNGGAEHTPLHLNGYLANGSALVPHSAGNASTGWANQQAYNPQMCHYGGVKHTPLQHNGYLENNDSDLVPHDARSASPDGANQQAYNQHAHRNRDAEQAALQQNGYAANALVPHDSRSGSDTDANANKQADYSRGVETNPMYHDTNGYLSNDLLGNDSLVPYGYPHHEPPVWAPQTYGYPGYVYGC